jgi:hypothetical protein
MFDGWNPLHTNDHGDTIDETGRIVNEDGTEPHGDLSRPEFEKCGCGHLKESHFASGECGFIDGCDCKQFDPIGK